MLSNMWLLFGIFAIFAFQADAKTAGFIKSPLSQMKIVEDSAELDCEVIGNPIPEVQWWFIEGEEPDEILTQLFDGARDDRVHINATYVDHATSTLFLSDLSFNDTGVYECRASNDPDRNDLRTPPKIKWIRSQANVIVFEHPAITTTPLEVNNQTSATLSCNLTNPSSPIKGHYWVFNGKKSAESDKPETYVTYTIDAIDYHSAGRYSCVYRTEPEVNATIEVKANPHVVSPKNSEFGNENDKAVLVCVSQGYPQLTDWTWYKLSEDSSPNKTALFNGTDKYEIKNTPNKTTLVVKDLDINSDMGTYECHGMNDLGSSRASIQLRVRSHLAALWPFLGIVAEVIILITIIFIYEKRRKPDEITDDDDSGSAPLKSNSATNHKDKNVRQRNSN